VQLTRDTTAANLIRAWEPGRIRVADRWIAGNVIVTPNRIFENWRVETPATLRVENLSDALAEAPEIVLLGTGADLEWPDLDVIGALAARGIGLEIMSTPAACRTFSVLVQEQRRVAAALFNVAPGATSAR
jgi:uncharacterized protein